MRESCSGSAAASAWRSCTMRVLGVVRSGLGLEDDDDEDDEERERGEPVAGGAVAARETATTSGVIER